MDNKLWNAQLYIAEEIKRICEKNNIHYFLDCGSMLGAVRHKGFIPWDDDMDIGMPKTDYDRFIKIAPLELRDEFYLDDYSINERCSTIYAKIRLKGTKYIEKKGNKEGCHNEIFIDIFPHVCIPCDIKRWKIEATILSLYGYAISIKAGNKPWIGDNLKKRIKFIPAIILGKITSFQLLHKKVAKYYSKYSNTNYVCVLDGCLDEYKKWIIPQSLLNNFIDVEFNGHIFPILKEYDQYLTILYGDYMKLPPENQRITHMVYEISTGEYKF